MYSTHCLVEEKPSSRSYLFVALQEILDEVVRELHKVKDEIINGKQCRACEAFDPISIKCLSILLRLFIGTSHITGCEYQALCSKKPPPLDACFLLLQPSD